MLGKRALIIINIALASVAILLLLSFFDVKFPHLGEAFYALDQHEPLCLVEWEEEQRKFTDLPRCCLEARRQDLCQWHLRQTVFGGTEWKCQAIKSEIGYLLNNKAYHYCTQLPFWKK